jgi:Uncharacterized NAD(FAD)-dependent dehydrogenases
MKIIVIGSVAAGTSVAAKARRNTEEAEIVIYEKDTDISYAVCGIPYAIGGEIEDFDELTPRDAPWFKKRYNVDIHTAHEVLAINHEQKELTIRNLQTNETFTDTYDVLVLATGSTYCTPTLFEGTQYPNVFQIKNIESGKRVADYVTTKQAKTALVIGAGSIGLEMAEQLHHLGIDVTVLQRSKHPMSHLDADMAARLEEEMSRQEIQFYGEETVVELIGSPQLTAVKTSKGRTLTADLFILATGVQPNVQLARQAGVALGATGAIAVNERLATNLADIYAVGDVAESFHLVTKQPIYRPLASTANKMGRIAGDVITGGQLRHRGILGTGIIRFFELTIAQTGLTETQAMEAGFQVATLYNIKPNKPTYMDGKEMVIKAIADQATGRFLGAQIIGYEGVDKRIDVLATALSFGALAEDLFHLDLAYAPPFSTTKDNVHYTGMALDNAVNHATPLLTPLALLERQEQGEVFQIIDTRSKSQFDKEHLPNALHIPLAELRTRSSELDKTLATVTYCNKGVTGNAAQNVLINQGFKEVYNLSGGNKNYQAIAKQKRL